MRVEDKYIGANDPEHIQPDLILIPADIATEKDEPLNELMKRPFRQVWRAFHLPGRPNFTPDGSFNSFDESPL